MQEDEFKAAIERLNAGAEIPAVAPSLIECYWNAISQLPKQQGMSVGICVGGFPTVDHAEMPQNPEQQLALMSRYGLLDAASQARHSRRLHGRRGNTPKGVRSGGYVPIQCERFIFEAMTGRSLFDSAVETAEKADEEFKKADYDLDHPRVGEALKQWMRDHC